MGDRALPRYVDDIPEGFDMEIIGNRRHYSPKSTWEESDSQRPGISLTSMQALGSITGVWVSPTETEMSPPESPIDDGPNARLDADNRGNL